MNSSDTSTHTSETSPAEPPSRLYKRFAIIGSFLGVFFPFCYGAWLIYSVWSQPEPPPGQALCGMPVLGGIVIIAFVCPLGAIVFAAIGAAVGGICDMFMLRRYPISRRTET